MGNRISVPVKSFLQQFKDAVKRIDLAIYGDKVPKKMGYTPVRSFRVVKLFKGKRIVVAFGVQEPELESTIANVKRRMIKIQEANEDGSPMFEMPEVITEEEKSL